MPAKKPIQRTQRRRLFFDIETSPNIGMFWEAGYKKNIDYSNILKERAIICICYKWEDDSEVVALHWDSKQSDKKMLEAFIKVANKADEMVAHNGDRYDLSWIRTRCLFHKIEMFPSYTTIDTLKISRSKFRFNSNKLDYIAQFLGMGKKIKTDFAMWKSILISNDKTSLAKMIKYCKMDVVLLEKVYKKMSSHIAVKTHFGVIFGSNRHDCPECGSDDISVHKSRYTASGTKRIQFQCKTCHKYHSKVDK
jgi:predicted PolB exonuclease-like 3'-5' exonuclease